MGHNPSRIGHFRPFCIFWGLGTSLRGSWARAFEQNKMAEPNPQPDEELANFPFINDNDVDGLILELPAYLAASNGVHATDILDW